MRKAYVFLVVGLLSVVIGRSQAKQDSLPKWEHKGHFGVLLNQAGFKNWLPGGVNNFSGILDLDLEWNHQSRRWEWRNTFDFALGYAKSQTTSFLIKTDDRMVFESLVKLRSNKAWNFSSSFDLKSQWASGDTYKKLTDASDKRSQNSRFFSPAYLRLGVGFTYLKPKKLQVVLNPLNARVILVNRIFTETLADGEVYFGVGAGKTSRWEAGASLSFQSTTDLAPNIEFKNMFNLVSNYLEEFKNVDLDYTGRIGMKVNKNVSASLEVQLVYDDNALAALQTRQILGVSVFLPF